MSALAYATRERRLVREASSDPRMAQMPVADMFVRVDRDPEAYERLRVFADAFGPIYAPAQIWQLAGPLMERLDSESIWTLLVDVHGKFRGIFPAHAGSIDRVEASLPHVLRTAVMIEANFFLLHNHPSGDSRPSDDDARLTRAAYKAVAQLHPLRMYDHLILGTNEIYSFRANQRWHMAA